MALYKAVSGQKISVFAWNTLLSAEETGDAANIAAQISIDGGATAATDDAAPTELDATDAPGIYLFDLTQAETNGDLIILFAKSSTSGVKLEPVIIYTLPGDGTAIAADTIEIEGSDATDQIRDSVVDDATRIDASSINAIEAKVDTIDNFLDTEMAQVLAGTVLVATTIESANRNTTNCQMIAGSVENDAYIGMRVVLVGDSGTGYVSRTITDYVASNNVVTWSPAIAQDPVDGGNIYIVPGDTTVNVTADAIKAVTDNLPDSGALNDLSSILADTDDIGVAGAGLTDLGGMSTGMKTEVESEVNDALVAINLDHLAKTVTAAADMTTEVVDNTILSRILANGDTSAFVPSTDGLQLIRDKLTDIEADTNELQTDDVPGLIAALNDIAATDVTQRQIPDSVPADGTRPTIEQALYMIVQYLNERSVSGTTVTVNKVDGSTTLMTFTISDATDPTSITRAS